MLLLEGRNSATPSPARSAWLRVGFWGTLAAFALAAAGGICALSMGGVAMLARTGALSGELIESDSPETWRRAAATLEQTAFAHAWIALPLLLAPVAFWLLLSVFRNAGMGCLAEERLARRVFERVRPQAENALTEGEHLVAASVARPGWVESAAQFLAPLPLLLVFIHGALPPTACLAILRVIGDAPDGLGRSFLNPLFILGYLAALGLCVLVRLVHRGGGVNLAVSGILTAGMLLYSADIARPWTGHFYYLAAHGHLSVVSEYVHSVKLDSLPQYGLPAFAADLRPHLHNLWPLLFLWDLLWFVSLSRLRLLAVTDRRLLVFEGARLPRPLGRQWRLRAALGELSLERSRSTMGTEARLRGEGYDDRVHWLRHAELDSLGGLLQKHGILRSTALKRPVAFGTIDLLTACLTLVLFVGWIDDYRKNTSELVWEGLLDAKLLPCLVATEYDSFTPKPPDERLRTAEFVLQLRPDKGTALLCKGDALRDLGRNEEAEQVYGRLLTVVHAGNSKLKNAANVRLRRLHSHEPEPPGPELPPMGDTVDDAGQTHEPVSSGAP